MTKQHNLMSIDDIQKLIHRDMQKTNETILAQLNSDVTLINQLGYYHPKWWKTYPSDDCDFGCTCTGISW